MPVGRLALRFSQSSSERNKWFSKSLEAAPISCAASLLRLAHEGPSSHIAEICELSNVRAYRFVPEDVKYRVAISAGRQKRCFLSTTNGRKFTRRPGSLIQSRGLFNADINFTPQHLEVDRLCEKRVGAAFQCLALGIGVAIRGDHDNWDVRPHCLRFGQ